MAQQILGPDRDTICFDTDGIPELFGKDNLENKWADTEVM